MGRLAFSLFIFFISAFPVRVGARPDSAENPCPKLLLKQVVEKNGVNIANPGGFSRTRTLLDYLRFFPTEVGEKIASLGGDSLILEAGSGEGIAAEQMLQSKIEDLVLDEAEQLRRESTRLELALDFTELLTKIGNKSLSGRPRVLGVSKEMERKVELAPYRGKLGFLSGRFFEDIPASELGRPNLILDPIGVMSYTTHPSEVLRKYLEILAPGGDIYLWMDGARIEIEMRREFTIYDGVRAVRNLRPTYANFPRWQVEKEDGKHIFFFDWLMSLNQPGLEVKEIETKMLLSHSQDHRRFLRENLYTTFRIRKTGTGEVRIPELDLIKVDPSSNPPGRIFKVVPAPK